MSSINYIPKITMVKMDSVKLDKDNPNIMTELQMNGLRESMKRFGFLDPISIDQNGNMIDGEHRYNIYSEFKKSEIPAIVINVKNNIELRLLRQSFNKLKGKHEFRKDLNDFHVILTEYDTNSLALLIGQEQKNIEYLIKEDVKASERLYNEEMKENIDQEQLIYDSILDKEKINKSQQHQHQHQQQQDKQTNNSKSIENLIQCPRCNYEFYT